ncbi:uncharacterized protein [Apostichopus japonicus]|uniref:uncharacterized protein isoform X2 n=1 Tax=Stichopus japonicus TaxID=307972 RepID=UPI003AB8FA5A
MSNFGGLTFKAVAVALVLIVAHPNQLAQAQFTNGATLASCVSLTEPGFTPQPAGTNPFRITFSQSFYRPDDVIQVTFDSATVQNFTGFICQARFSNGDTTPVGSFINQNINDYRTLSCSSTDDTITNTGSTQKTLPVTFTWRAPPTGPTQEVVFVTSVVLPNGQFYERSQSLPLAVTNPCSGSPCLNGGTCTVFGITFQCSCVAGFSDTNCQTPVTQTFAECPGQVTETQVGNGMVRVSFANPVCPAGQVSSCTAANNALVTSTNPVDVCCTCSSSQSQSQCCFARVFDPQSLQSYFVTSISFPGAYPQGMTYNTVVTSSVNLQATLLYFVVPPPVNNLADTLSIGAGGVIGNNVLNTYDTSRSSGVTVIGGNTLWISFVSTSENAVSGRGFVFQIEAPNNSPIITCPADLSIKADTGASGVLVTYDNPSCSDSDGATPAVSCTPPSGIFLRLGPTTVNCICTDNDGATDSCTFSITVFANTLPVISCLGDVTEISLPGNVGNQVSYPVPACFDNEDNNALLQVVCVPPPGSFFQGVTSTRVTCTCTDTCNEVDTCTFLVNIIAPNIPPSITCPADLTVKSNSAVTRSQVIFDNPLCFDPDGQNEVVTCTPSSGQFLPLGATQVTCTCTDSAGATDVCSFSISVIANTLPVISCLGDVTEISLPGNVGNQVSYPVPACFDNEDSNALLQVVCVPPPGSFFQGVTSTPVTCTCTDTCNEVDTCSFLVNIIALNVPPSITCPTDLSFKVDSGNPGATITFDPPSCFDPDQPTGSLAVSCDPMRNSFLSLGPNPVFCVCTDNTGATDTCTFTVTVVENSLPTISCPAPVTVTSVQTNIGNTITYDNPVCFDAEDGIFPAVCNPLSGTFFVGVSTVTCTCTDSCDESTLCSFQVTVLDLNELPAITCPSNITESVEAGTSGVVLPFNVPMCFDPDQPSVTLDISCSVMPNSFFTIGDTPVNCTCTDNAGDIDTCVFDVIVIAVDTTPPQVTCPNDVTVQVLSGNEGSIVTFTNPSAVDNFGDVFIVGDIEWYSGFYFPLGETTVEYVFSDDAGNTATCIFCVAVIASSPCDSNPCLNGGECLAESLFDFTCFCSGCFQGNLCQIPLEDPCTFNSCLNGGECEVFVGSCTQTFCECQSCTRGERCEIMVDPCSENSCANGAQCVPDPNDCSAYSCTCAGCFTGTLCTTLFDPCSLNLCQNGAFCLATGDSCLTYSCTCQGCFEGFNCDRAIPNPCLNSPCQNGGFCQRQEGSCSAFTCICLSGFSGPTCETRSIVVRNACLRFPCQNDGCCVSLPNDNYKCLCRDGYTGVDCQDLAGISNSPCDSNPCANGATCLNSYSSESNVQFFIPQYTCICPVGFSGMDCGTFTFENDVLDQCSQSSVICRNQGTCWNTYCSFSQAMGTYCSCLEGFYGNRCEFSVTNPCLSMPCRNGGQCTSFTKYFVCQCANGFSGDTCEIGIVDVSPPTIDNCPSDITVTANPGETYADVTWPDIIVFDDSGTVALVRNTGRPGIYQIGVYTIIYQYRDAAGNVVTCTFILTVLAGTGTPVDNEPPVISGCPGDITETTSSNSASVTWVDPRANDNSGVTALDSRSHFPGQVFAAGTTTTVSYIFMDPSGNRAVCRFDVTVIQVETGFCLVNPDFCQNGGVCNDGVNGAVCSCAGGFAGERCAQELILVSSLPSGVLLSPNFGTLNVEGPNVGYIIQGNSTALNLEVFSIDIRQGDEVQFGAGSVVGVGTIDTFNGVSGANNLPQARRLFQIPSSSCWVTFNTNMDGMSGIGFAFRITGTPVDNEPPVISGCPGDITETTSSNSASVTWVDPRAVDNSGITLLDSRSHFPGQVFATGTTTTVSYIFMDPSGNRAVCSFDVTVIQVETGFCLVNPDFCQNGGVCNDGVNGAVCSCAGGFSGERCAQELILVSSLPSGVLLSPDFGTLNVEGPNVGYIIQGNSTALNLEVFFIDIRQGDEVQFGAGSVVGFGTIDTFNGVSGANNLPQARRFFQIPSSSCWVTFNTNMDGMSGSGFAFRITV